MGSAQSPRGSSCRLDLWKRLAWPGPWNSTCTTERGGKAGVPAWLIHSRSAFSHLAVPPSPATGHGVHSWVKVLRLPAPSLQGQAGAFWFPLVQPLGHHMRSLCWPEDRTVRRSPYQSPAGLNDRRQGPSSLSRDVPPGKLSSGTAWPREWALPPKDPPRHPNTAVCSSVSPLMYRLCPVT